MDSSRKGLFLLIAEQVPVRCGQLFHVIGSSPKCHCVGASILFRRQRLHAVCILHGIFNRLIYPVYSAFDIVTIILF